MIKSNDINTIIASNENVLTGRASIFFQCQKSPTPPSHNGRNYEPPRTMLSSEQVQFADTPSIRKIIKPLEF